MLHQGRLSLDFKPVSDVRAELGESPVWSEADACVWWVDISGQRLLRTGADGATETWEMPEQVGFVALATAGLVVGMESGLFAFDPASGVFERLVALEAPGVRFNDATTDAAGRLWAGTMDLENRRPVGQLLRIDPDLTVTVVAEGMRTPNGLAVDSPGDEAGGRLFFSDSHPDVQTIWVADLDIRGGRIAERRIFARMHEAAGRPDGGALDEDGNYWSAGVDGGAIHVFTPDGNHLFEFLTPMPDPTKIAFGGPDLRHIYLTSKAGSGAGGQLAVIETAFRGRETTPFGYRRPA